MRRKYLLVVTAFGEAATGLLLLFLPSVVFELLLHPSSIEPAGLFVGRIAGAALIAIGVASWLARKDRGCPAQVGILLGVLFYDVVAAVLLAYAGLALNMTGVLLWPAVVFHVAMAGWTAACVGAVVLIEP
ncbi:MAG TPA: hypothetical protein VHR66_27955 [Gemmataceae bacterium]|jgi:hypothetical protein|nr:hypothetical protein [Gemmataceae bacterium]